MEAQLAHDAFFHVRVIIGLVAGLCITRLLTGLARFVQHPARPRLYPVHLGWVLFLLLAVLHFWWFEFGLGRIGAWSFELYLFVVGYASLFFFTSTLLFPDRIDEYAGFADYFHARQRWFYGFLALILLTDIVDTIVKGDAHLRALGPAYVAVDAVLAGFAFVAIGVRDRRFHAAFVILALAAQLWRILRQLTLFA
ncbi:hypothetical protein [Amaricoccus sp.]|uniref:hypothetical protein n=1 Tax=Amaricoccus sp. TaxID=1872485 RepID=UPI00262266A6|nr:hypothetical protein [Amaricoccus sp.]HRO12452.1 hypothetical protein [Amaricoccus sp.]